MKPRENGVWRITRNVDSLKRILESTQKAAEASHLDRKQSLRIQLLAEELVEMLPGLLSFTDGEFWVENDGKSFELHTVLSPNESLSLEKREKLLDVSSSGKNAAAVGIMAKIKLAAYFMLVDYDSNAVLNGSFYMHGMADSPYFPVQAWSLNAYRENVGQEKGKDWDELEKSIVANIADEVLVGIQGKKVEIIVKKAF